MEANPKQPAATTVAVLQTSTCFICKKPIADNQWFCRLTQKVKEAAYPQAANILLCSPACASRHFATSKPESAMNVETKTRVL